jgi:hypothetical protein
MKRISLLILMLLTVIEACHSDILIDPNSGGSGFSVNIKFFAPTGQSFTADGANLVSIGMWTDTCNCPNDPPIQFQLTLLNGSGTSGTLVATRTATAPIGLSGFLDFDFTGTTLAVGQTYTAVMTQISLTPPDQTGTDIAGTSNVYSGGIGFISGQASPGLDFFLRVRSAPASAQPTVSSISPVSGNQGQTITVTVTGSNFLPGATIYFVGATEILASQISSVSSDGTSATGSLTIPLNAALETKSLKATNTGSLTSQTLPNAFTIYAREFPIFVGPASEPSLAVDPLNSLHAVVGFIDASRSPQPQTCGWKETFDGGNTWNPNGAAGSAGAFPLPFYYNGAASDPWVRFSPTGDLLYSCIGTITTNGNTAWASIFVAISTHKTSGMGGLAGQLALGKQVIASLCTFSFSGCAFPDHPSMTMFGSKARVLACWAEFSGGTSVVKTSVSIDGNTWSQPQVVSSGRLCTVGGNSIEGAVTWFNDQTNSLFWATSSDGKTWSKPVALDAAGALIYGSTTDKVLAGPYALVVPAGAGLLAVYQIRDNGISKVFVRDLAAGSQRLPLGGNETVEKFLPGVGACGKVAGSYQIMSGGVTFRYAGWYTTASSFPLFVSGADLYGTNGFTNAPLPKINDYTGADCANDGFGWLAWTDLRSGVPNEPQIWGTRFPLK